MRIMILVSVQEATYVRQRMGTVWNHRKTVQIQRMRNRQMPKAMITTGRTASPDPRSTAERTSMSVQVK